MTTLQQNQPPVLCYEIWEYADVIRGRIIDEKPWYVAKGQYDYSYDLRGRTAHFVVVTNVAHITKKDAIEFAVSVLEGRIKRLNVDLTPCNPKPKK